MSKEKVSYVTYSEGLEAKHLHLGNLVHSYKSPNSLEPHVETAYTDVAEPAPAWARVTQLDNYALTLGKSSTEQTDADGNPRYEVAAAAKTIKIEIKDPESFFNEVTLKSNTARKWLFYHLSASEALAASQGNSHPRPQIWMLTGLILMTHATWTSLSSKDQAFIPGLQAPFDPTGVSAMRRLSVSDGVRPTFGLTVTDEVKHVSGSVIHETGKYPGTRGWAAQWQKVDVKFVPAEQSQDVAINQLRLKGTSEISGKIAQLELREDVYAVNEAQDNKSVEDIDDDYWDAFLDATEEST